MRRGTTPTFTFTADIDCAQFDKLEIHFAQKDKVILSKTLTDCNIDCNTITVRLTEEESLMFNCHDGAVQIQIRAGMSGERLASQIMLTSVESILKEGCL